MTADVTSEAKIEGAMIIAAAVTMILGKAGIDHHHRTEGETKMKEIVKEIEKETEDSLLIATQGTLEILETIEIVITMILGGKEIIETRETREKIDQLLPTLEEAEMEAKGAITETEGTTEIEETILTEETIVTEETTEIIETIEMEEIPAILEITEEVKILEMIEDLTKNLKREEGTITRPIGGAKMTNWTISTMIATALQSPESRLNPILYMMTIAEETKKLRNSMVKF